MRFWRKKAKKMDVLNSKADDEFLKRHTFTPQTHANKGDLNFKKFLENQKEHLDKINDVVGIIKEENEEVINAEITHHPNINYKSEILFDEKIKTNQPTYLRLYNKRKHFKKEGKKKKKAKENGEENKNDRIKDLYMEVFRRKRKILNLGKEVYKSKKRKKIVL